MPEHDASDQNVWTEGDNRTDDDVPDAEKVAEHPPANIGRDTDEAHDDEDDE
jgi:hypothetical protein